MVKRLGLSALGFGLLAMGCGVETSDEYSNVPTVDESPEFDFDRAIAGDSGSDVDESDDSGGLNDSVEPDSGWGIVVRDGRLSADVDGYIVNGAAQSISSFGDADHFVTDLIRVEEDSAMAIIDIVELNHAIFSEAGRRTQFHEGVPINVMEEGPSLTMTVCAGPNDTWEIDREVADVEVIVLSNDDGERVLSIDSEEMRVELNISVPK